MALTELGVARGPGVEVREGYTDLVIAGLQAQAAGNVARAAATGGLQTVAGIISRALSTAEADGDMGVLSARVLGDIAYDLVRRGQSLHLLTVDECGPRLLRAQVTSQSAIRGSSSDPDDWTYVLTLNGPGTSKAVTVGAETVVDVRLNTTVEQPWRGRSPLEVALLTGQLHANLEQSLGVLSACGVPAPMADPKANGPALVQSRAMLRDNTIEPIARLVSAEVSRVLETPVRLRLPVSDVAARARAVHTMTQSGVEKDRAIELAGWDG